MIKLSAEPLYKLLQAEKSQPIMQHNNGSHPATYDYDNYNGNGKLSNNKPKRVVNLLFYQPARCGTKMYLPTVQLGRERPFQGELPQTSRTLDTAATLAAAFSALKQRLHTDLWHAANLCTGRATSEKPNSQPHLARHVLGWEG